MISILKPCHCGSQDIALFYRDNALVWELRCLKCNICYTHAKYDYIVNLWNTRPLEDALRSENDKLKAQMSEIQVELDLNFIAKTKAVEDALRAKLDKVKTILRKGIGIPFYAYGDNEAGRQMKNIIDEALQVLEEK